MASLDIVIMAAGKGTRMKSARPKVLHPLAGKSLLQHVLDAVAGLAATKTLVITGHAAQTLEAQFGAQGLTFVRQQPQLGTGHAVQQAVPHLDSEGTTLILNGDVPLIEPATAAALVAASGGTKLALLTIELADATGYGRIVRDGTVVRRIVEERDASAGPTGDPRGLHRHARRAHRVAEVRRDGADQRQRPARVLPDRHRGHGGGRRRAGGDDAGHQRDRSARRQQPGPTGRARAPLPVGARRGR